MIDIKEINVDDLSFVSFNEINLLPNCPGIYFVIGQDSSILYIGQSKNLQKRFMNHHRINEMYEQSARRVHWLIYKGEDTLEVEGDAISYFSPSLNVKRPGQSRPSPVPFRLISDRDKENFEFLQNQYPCANSSEVMRYLLEDYRIKCENDELENQKLDELIAQNECLHAKVEMLLCEHGIKPIEK